MLEALVLFSVFSPEKNLVPGPMALSVPREHKLSYVTPITCMKPAVDLLHREHIFLSDHNNADSIL
jgi:hypothetical protein